MAVRQSDVMHMAVVAMGRHGSFVRSPEPWSGMHSLIHILFLDIDMAVDVNDADIAIDMRGDPTDIGKAQAMVAAADDGEHARRVNVRDGFCDLIECFF